MEALLAKTPDPNAKQPGVTLVSHTAWVFQAAEFILQAVRGDLPKDIDYSELRLLAVAGAILHDLGKATNVFQGMLNKEQWMRGRLHPIRHEVLSALLIAEMDTGMKGYLSQVFQNKGEHWLWMLAWVAGGHHLCLHRERASGRNATEANKLVRVQNIPNMFEFYGSQVGDILRMVKRLTESDVTLPVLPVVVIPTQESDVIDAEWHGKYINDFVDHSREAAKDLTEKDQRLLAIAKAVVIAADVAGSALTKCDEPSISWIRKSLGEVLSAENLQKIIDDRLKGDPLKRFQEYVEASDSSVTLVIAGCGNGKTIAAYAWAKRRAKGRKLFFCYPTTGTASAGFEDYLLAQSDLERALIHGRSQVDMERMLGTPEDAGVEENQRLESLKVWSQQVVACTVDTVLGLIQNQRRGLFSFPVILRGAFVFDEIHSYDAKLFGALLCFLKTFPRLPVLLMSASIPDHRLKALQDALGQRLSKPILGDREIEEIPRYRIDRRETPENCWPEVMHALAIGKKILWVCNRVRDAVAIYDKAIEQIREQGLDIEPILYHSRYRYKDRVEKQTCVISALKPESKGPSLVIATQVCEMSLHISAELMVTALPPFPALIQRLGRLNREGEVEGGGLCLVYSFTCQEGQPYKQKELEASHIAIDALVSIGKVLSQQALAEKLKSISIPEEVSMSSAWLGDITDGNVWESDQRPLRSGGDSWTVLLEQDKSDILSRLNGQRPTAQNVAAWTIPMWFKPGIPITERMGGYPVISAEFINYDTGGAKWRNMQKP